MVEVMQYRAPGATATPSPIGPSSTACAALAGLDDDEILDERFLRRMTVAHTLPLARRGGLAGRPAIDAPSSGQRVPGRRLVGPAGMLADASAASALAAAGGAVGVARRVAARAAP